MEPRHGAGAGAGLERDKRAKALRLRSPATADHCVQAVAAIFWKIFWTFSSSVAFVKGLTM
jgi:hypothetical protein